MPKHFILDNIFNTLNQEQRPNTPHHFLFMLGTDTKYVSKPLPSVGKILSDYEKGETLSYAAQLTARLLNETPEINENAVHAFSSPSIDLLIGPTTRGTEVGDRIARAIYYVLLAVASGKSNLLVAAHSRGAAEFILVLQELERIKQALQNSNLSLHDALKASPCSMTSLAFTNFFPKASALDTQASRSKLLERLSSLTINPFLIDPVPGGTIFYLPGLQWKDKRFFQNFSCENYELIICRDERTCCFKPIVPPGVKPTILPGHHGSLSGNLNNQKKTKRANETEALQELALAKMLMFFYNATGQDEGPFAFNRTSEIDLQHPDLDLTTNAFLSREKGVKPYFILSIYKILINNDQYYKKFTSDGYIPLTSFTTECAKDGSRIIHFGNDGDTALTSFTPDLKEKYINIEHAQLALRALFGTPEFDQPSTIVNNITNAINQFKQNLIAPSMATSEIYVLLNNKDNFTIVADVLSILVDDISQKFLRNHLSKEERRNLVQAIKKVLDSLSFDQIPQRSYRRMFQSYRSIIEKSMQTTIAKYYDNVIQQTKDLSNEVDLYFQDIGDLYNEFLVQVAQEPSLNAIYENLRSVSPVNLQTVKTALDVHMRTIATPDEVATPALQESPSSEALHSPSHQALDAAMADEYMATPQESPDSETGNSPSQGIETTLAQGSPTTPGMPSPLSPEALKTQDEATTPKLQESPADTLMKCSSLLYKAIAIKERTPQQYVEHLAQLHEMLEGLSVNYHYLQNCFTEDAFDNDEESAAVAESNFLATSPLSPLDEEAPLRPISTLAQAARKTIHLGARFINSGHTIQTSSELPTEILDNMRYHADQEAARMQREQTKLSLRSARDQRSNAIIQNELLPLVSTYLNRLKNKAEKYKLQSPGRIKIEAKIAAVEALQTILRDNKVSPSQRITLFRDQLTKSKKELAAHRDPSWLRFTKACFAVLAIIATGVLPYLAYSAIKGNSLSFFSKGEQFARKCADSARAMPGVR